MAAPVPQQWQLAMNAPVPGGVGPNHAGPQLNPTYPPWSRPSPQMALRGNTTNTQAAPVHWDPASRLLFAGGIPPLVVPPPARIGAHTTDQRTVNDFLARLDQAVQARRTAPPNPRPAGVPIRPLQHGLVVFDREVSSSNELNRRAEFGSVNLPGQNQTINPQGGGAGPHPTWMRLRDYSAHQVEAANAARPQGGTLYLVASRDNIANPAQTAIGRNLIAQGTPAAALQYLGGAWHNTGLLVLSLASIGQVYGGLRRVLIYDPSYPNDGAAMPTTHPTTGTLSQQPPVVRLQHLLYNARTRGLLQV